MRLCFHDDDININFGKMPHHSRTMLLLNLHNYSTEMWLALSV